MVKKCISKILLLTLFVIMVLSLNCNYTYASHTAALASDGGGGGSGTGTSATGSTMSELITDLDEGNPEDKTAGKVNDIVATVITIARVVGVAVAIVMLLAVAMKYMTAAPGEKADIKKSAVIYVVGAIVLFAVTGILGIINTFASNIS